ncbi:MAG: HTH domain-containing protein [Patescibacteria group bacterium]
MEKIRSAKTIIDKATSGLKEKEALVIRGRFGIDGRGRTLSSIGRDLHLSRERIRQIEKEGLKKVAKYIAEENSALAGDILGEIKTQGIIHKEDIAAKVLESQALAKDEEINSLNLIIKVVPEVQAIEKHDELHESWILNDLSKDEVIKILRDWANYLKKQKSPQKLDILIDAHPNHKVHKISFLSYLPRISKKIVEDYEGSLGLSEWPEVNPRTVRDKIYYVLRKNKKPMHFTDIAKVISEEQFDKKKVVPATVHNELIADARFVLIGRGIYALKEWGYAPGTVKDIIIAVLKQEDGAMDFSDIYKEVLKQRQVRKNTVLINLQNQSEFKKIGSSKYILA